MLLGSRIASWCSSEKDYDGGWLKLVFERPKAVFRMYRTGNDHTIKKPFEYSFNGIDWTTFYLESSDQSSTSMTTDELTVEVPGDHIYLRAADNDHSMLAAREYSARRYVITTADSTGFEAYGDVRSLIYRDFEDSELTDWCFSYLFTGSYLTKAPDLPFERLSAGCYRSMFSGCTRLVDPPDLPAKILSESCYAGMFNGCENLQKTAKMDAEALAPKCCSQMYYRSATRSSVGFTAEDLGAKHMESECYLDMFRYSGIVVAPRILAEDTAFACFEGMFANCTKLVTPPPEIKARDFAEKCCWSMFEYCDKLESIPSFTPYSFGEFSCLDMFGDCYAIKPIDSLLIMANEGAHYCFGIPFSGSRYSQYGKTRIGRFECRLYDISDETFGNYGWAGVEIDEFVCYEFVYNSEEFLNSYFYKHATIHKFTLIDEQDEIVPVEYIESTGNGHIDTGVVFGDGVTGLNRIGYEYEIDTSLDFEKATVLSIRLFGFGASGAAGYFLRFYNNTTTGLANHSVYATAATSLTTTNEQAAKRCKIRVTKVPGSSYSYFYRDGEATSPASKSTTATAVMTSGITANIMGIRYGNATSGTNTSLVCPAGARVYRAIIKNTITGQEVVLTPMKSKFFGACMKDELTGNILYSEPRRSLKSGPMVELT